MTKKNIAVIGLGSIGMRHAKNLHDLGHKVFGYDPDKKAAAELQKMWGGGAMTGSSTDLDEVIERSEAVVIASPTETHFDMIAKCEGKPVFVEKPIGGRGAPIVGNVIMVGYNLRFHHCVKTAKSWIADGLIGEPLWANFVCAQYNDRPEYLRDGVILNWSHEIDLALYLLGPAKLASSMTRLNRGKDDMVDIILSHSKCPSTIHLDYVTQPEIRQTVIVGKEGSIILDLRSRNAWLRGNAGIIMDHVEAHDSFDDNYVEEMNAFIDRIDGNNTIGCTAEEALAVLKICLNVRTQAGLL